jgi:hypothetical protein
MSKWYENVKRDRFDEEDAIMACWNIIEEINFLWVQIMDGAPMSDDEICNILLGMQQQYDRKFDGLFETFKQAHGLDGYNKGDNIL